MKLASRHLNQPLTDGLVITVEPIISAGTGAAVHAIVVYEKLGLRMLGKVWLNTDGLWAATFVMADAIPSSHRRARVRSVTCPSALLRESCRPLT